MSPQSAAQAPLHVQELRAWYACNAAPQSWLASAKAIAQSLHVGLPGGQLFEQALLEHAPLQQLPLQHWDPTLQAALFWLHCVPPGWHWPLTHVSPAQHWAGLVHEAPVNPQHEPFTQEPPLQQVWMPPQAAPTSEQPPPQAPCRHTWVQQSPDPAQATPLGLQVTDPPPQRPSVPQVSPVQHPAGAQVSPWLLQPWQIWLEHTPLQQSEYASQALPPPMQLPPLVVPALPVVELPLPHDMIRRDRASKAESQRRGFMGNSGGEVSRCSSPRMRRRSRCPAGR